MGEKEEVKQKKDTRDGWEERERQRGVEINTIGNIL